MKIEITPAQIRAARALLDWTQEELANNAQVARATVVDFERFDRVPVPNNRVSITNSLEAAGIEFIPDNGSGEGVRFRNVHLEYSRTLSEIEGGVSMRVLWRGARIRVLIPENTIQDMPEYDSRGGLVAGVQRRLPVFLRAIERKLEQVAPAEGAVIHLCESDFPGDAFR